MGYLKLSRIVNIAVGFTLIHKNVLMPCVGRAFSLPWRSGTKIGCSVSPDPVWERALTGLQMAFKLVFEWIKSRTSGKKKAEPTSPRTRGRREVSSGSREQTG